MNRRDDRYAPFGLVRDMLDAAEIAARFDPSVAQDVAQRVASVGRLFMTGEGSSRIFPAKHVIDYALKSGCNLHLHTEAGKQAQDYDLADWAVFGLSNSGKTAEVIGLFDQLKQSGHQHLYSLTAFSDTKLEALATRGFVLTCGEEGAVAATKSVVEQALFYRALIEHAVGGGALAQRLPKLGEDMTAALQAGIPADLVDRLANARLLFFAGRNDGVAEELTLKTNEITRKPSDFLEGTYAVHGIEEIMTDQDVVVWIDPIADQEDKFHKTLVEDVGLSIIAVSHRDTRFPTIKLPDAGDLNPYVQLCAGWNLLVETGLKLGIDLDKPERARKVGNEYLG